MALKTVFMTMKPMEAQIVSALLSDHDIDSFIENEFGNQLGLGAQAPMIPILVNVDESREAEALKIIGDPSKLPKRSGPTRSGFVTMACISCGKKLETAEGDEPLEECPWCGKPPTSKS